MQPLSMSLVTPVAFFLWHVKLYAVEKVNYQSTLVRNGRKESLFVSVAWTEPCPHNEGISAFIIYRQNRTASVVTGVKCDDGKVRKCALLCVTFELLIAQTLTTRSKVSLCVLDLFLNWFFQEWKLSAHATFSKASEGNSTHALLLFKWMPSGS